MALRGPVREERRYDSKLTEGALVLEGGSLRSVFTAGVLDTLLEHEIRLSYVNDGGNELHQRTEGAHAPH